jgi:ATP-dependent Lon protease
MASALASLYTEKKVRSDTSMTGEITLSGLVFPVGGIKEKVLSAHRAGIRRIILPQKNEADIEEIPEEVRKDLEIILANRIDDVLDAALEGQASPTNGKNYAIQDIEPHTDGRSETLIAKDKG